MYYLFRQSGLSVSKRDFYSLRNFSLSYEPINGNDFLIFQFVLIIFVCFHGKFKNSVLRIRERVQFCAY